MICVDDMRDLFQYKSIFNGDIRNWNVGAVKNIQSMFYRDNSRWDVRAVRDVQQTQLRLIWTFLSIATTHSV